MSDSITFLYPLDSPPLRKVFSPAGVQPYPRASRFRAEVVPVASLSDLADALEERREAGCCAITGELVPGTDPSDMPRRSKSPPVTIRDAAHRWVVFDFDSVLPAEWPAERVAQDPGGSLEALRAALPPLLATEVATIAQLTASAGYKPGIHARLWFWLAAPIAAKQYRTWLAADAWWGAVRPDKSLGVPCQPIYICDPVYIPDQRSTP